VVACLGELRPGERNGWTQFGRRLDRKVRPQASLFDSPAHDDPTDDKPVEVNLKGVRLERLRDFGDVWLAWGLSRLLGLDTLLAQQMAEGREAVPWPVVAAILKCYYPAFSGFFGGLNSDIALDFLLQYPTQKQMQRFSEARLRNWLRRHHYPFVRRIDAMVEHVKQPVLPVAEHLQEAKKPLIGYLADSLKRLNRQIDQRDRQINQHHAALRALAHRWLKILLALKRSQQRYNEEIFLHSQRRYRLQKPTLYAGG